MELLKLAVVLFTVTCAWLYTRLNKTERSKAVKKLNLTYDYIIVGAGSSGAVLAARLSENDNSSILVLEAGDDNEENPIFDIPRNHIQALNSEADWQYKTVPQKHAAGSFINRQIPYSQGKRLGGSSQLNVMAFVRGSKHDFNEWAEEGCEGWSYEDLLPYFKKLENIMDDKYAESDYRGKSGPVKIISETYSSSFYDILLQAAKEKGTKIGDYNAEDQEVFGKGQKNIIDGLRGSTARVFLQPAMSRQNLHVAVKAHVTKVLFEGKTATGVEFIHDGEKKKVKAKKEVILSAGSFGSPKILMLSGIGPQKHLQQLNIPVRENLPVGYNLDDHLFVPLKFFITNSQSSVEIKTDTLLEWIKYKITGKSVVFGLPAFKGDAMNFLRVGPFWKKKYPNIQLIFNPPNNEGQNVEIFLRSLAYNDESLKHMSALPSDIPENSMGFIIFVILLNAKSKGTVKLTSRDPFDHPEIDPHYLEDIQDVKSLVAGIRNVQSLISTESFKKNGIIFGESPYARCLKPKFDSDAYWECYVRHMAFLGFHVSSTCRMGPKHDKNSVVDEKLRVKGIQGLRVVDASIMRRSTSGNTNAPCMMIGEKAADIIKGG